jgi:oligopeptidase A
LVIKDIEKNSTEANWGNFVEPLEKIDEKLSRVWSQISHINSVMNSESFRKEYNKNLIKITNYYSELAQNSKIFKGYQFLKEKERDLELNAIQKKIVNDELKSFKLGGIGLPKNKRESFKLTKSNLSKLSSKFEENILDSINNFSLHAESKIEVEGIPKDVLSKASILAKENNKKGWLFTLDFPSYIPLMQYAKNRKLREDMYRAYATKASELSNKKLDNGPCINEILLLKQKLAYLLSYEDYAEMSLVTKMANSSEEVVKFLKKLAKKAKPHAKKDIKDLNEIAKKFQIDSIEAWDIAYLSEIIKEKKFNFSDLEIKNYFPKPKVLSGLFKLVSKIYGVKILKKNTDVWHKDVEFYEIYDNNNQSIGHFYLDLYARKNKRGGAWMDDARARFKFDNVQSTPIAFLTCNFSGPSRGKPAYFTHDEVITLFHEFGHGLHHLLTEIDNYSVSGIKNVEWDAVELPSQFMENFCWEWSVIKDMTEHVDTKKTMPKSLFNKMIAAKNFQSGMQTLRQVEFALFDILLHSSEYDPKSKNFLDLLEKVRNDIAVVRPPKWNRFPHSFSHIFAGGYAAGYYSYKWAEVLSADVYSLFEEKGVFSRTIGNKFRKEVLAKGGSRSALKSFVAFRGRKPKIDALLIHSGLKS